MVGVAVVMGVLGVVDRDQDQDKLADLSIAICSSLKKKYIPAWTTVYGVSNKAMGQYSIHCEF